HHPYTADIYTLSLHDALPILGWGRGSTSIAAADVTRNRRREGRVRPSILRSPSPPRKAREIQSPPSSSSTGRSARRGSSTSPTRSEEHTSELQSRFDLVCRLL